MEVTNKHASAIYNKNIYKILLYTFRDEMYYSVNIKRVNKDPALRAGYDTGIEYDLWDI